MFGNDILLLTYNSPFSINFPSDILLFPFSLDYGTTDKAKSISLKVLNEDNCREVTDRTEEEEKTKGQKEGRAEQVLEVKRSTTGSLYPDLSLLTDG